MVIILAYRDLAKVVPLPLMRREHQLNLKLEDDSLENDNKKRKLVSEDVILDAEIKRIRTSPGNNMDIEDYPPSTPIVIETNTDCRDENMQTTTLPAPKKTELEDGEIADSPHYFEETDQQQIWWLKQPLVAHFKKDDETFQPPPFPLTSLPLHKISQILPGQLNHISLEDRSRWFDPIFGNLQVRTGRFEKLKTILAARENKRKSL